MLFINVQNQFLFKLTGSIISIIVIMIWFMVWNFFSVLHIFISFSPIDDLILLPWHSFLDTNSKMLITGLSSLTSFVSILVSLNIFNSSSTSFLSTSNLVLHVTNIDNLSYKYFIESVSMQFDLMFNLCKINN